jgi:UDP-GlcNAc:undecaprenyl-phosphate GlcNAc-1-phosphate transferase
MRAFVFAFILAAVSSAALTPVVRRIALRVGAVSNPGGRNVNQRTIPRLGGIAISLAFFISLLALLPTHSSVAATLRGDCGRIVGLAAGAILLAGVGVLDDTRRVAARYKLLCQVIAATIAFAGGFRIDAILLPVLGALPMGVFALPVTVFWIVGVVNAINLIDGLDGLAAGIAFFAGVTNFVVACVSHDTFLSALMAMMLGSVLGFLFFNFNPARIFMGDSGSYFLGFILGTTSVNSSSQKASTAVSIIVPMLALGVPIFDTLFAMLRRFLERRPMFSPDRGHIHHRLLDMGITHKRAVLILYGVSIVLTAAAIGVSLGRSWEVGVALLTATVVVVGLVRFLGYFEYLFLARRQRARLRGEDTEALRRILPEVPGLFATAMNEEAVWRTLADLLSRAGLSVVELLELGATTKIRSWSIMDASGIEDMISARFPLGDDRMARAELRFRWVVTNGDVSPQTEVLLQVLVDIVTTALVRVSSPFAPVLSAPAKEAETQLSPPRTSEAST